MTQANVIRAQHFSYDGKRYEFTLTAQHQAGCPKWDTAKDGNPPLTAAKALDKAKEFIATIKTKDGLWWEFQELALVESNGWLWQARFRLTRRGLMTGARAQMDCWILMDGTIIQPRIIEENK